MKWIEPKYSKERVKKAGKSIINASANSREFKEAIPVFHNWRSAHAFPMQIMLDLLRKNSIRIDKNALAVQRLKRIPSILSKLTREKDMNLSRMEDIGGCRVVVANVSQAHKICDKLKNCRTKHILHRERNYITNPKESGYRGIHLVFKYNGNKKDFNGIPVEIQIRSKIQHSWATAVEVAGAFTKQALKASKGDSDWLDFFKYTSVEFAKLEGLIQYDIDDGIDTYALFNQLFIKLDIENRLRAFNVAVETITNKKENGAGYYILLLDMEKKVIRVSRYKKSQLVEATEFYDSEEEKHKLDESKDLVMVSAKSVKDLKKAYPNYFSDTAEFTKNLQKIHKANKDK
ncbi:MAG: RelA/SpoT domain-containing protein [bacterium]|nr:RelA/SpoT domain-containing protein [bacterium]